MAKKTVGELVYKITGDSKGLGATLAKTDAQVSGLGKNFGKLSPKAVAALAGVGVAVGVLGGTLVSATKRAIAFETQMGNIQTLIGDDSAGVEKLSKGILNLTKVIPRSADELGAASYDILSAGITDASEALVVLEASGELAVAGLGTTKEAVNLTTSAINAFGLEASDADDIANTVFATVRAGKTTVGELAQSFGNVAAAAQGSGVSFKEVQAATAALTVVGFKTATAQDRLRALFDELTRSSGKLATGIEEVGIENVGATIKADGFKSILDELLASVNGDTIAFKNMFSSVEAGGAALALVTGASDIYNETLQSMTTSSGDLEKAFSRQADTTANQLAIAQNEMNVLLTQLGQDVLPVVNKALRTFTATINDVRDGLAFLGGSSLDNYIDKTEQATARTSLLTDELVKVRKGTSDFSREQVESAVVAQRLTGEYDKLTEINKQLEIVQTGNSIATRTAKKDLAALGVELDDYKSFWSPSTFKIQEQARIAQIEFAEKLGLTSDKLGKLRGNLEDVLNPYKELSEEIEENTVTQEDLAEQIRATEEAQRKAEAASKLARQELETFQGSMLGFIETSANAGKALREELGDGFKKFADDLQGSLNDSNKGLAGIVIGAEEEIARLKREIKNQDDRERRKELKEELKAQQEILDESVGFEERRAERLLGIREKLAEAGIGSGEIDNLLQTQSLEEEIAEQRRVASLNEFQRFEEEQTRKLIAITDQFIQERALLEAKIEQQTALEAELTTFLLDQNAVRSTAVDEFANKAIAKYGEIASSLRSAISLQSQLNSLRSGGGREQFHDGGYVGAKGGEVHAGEYVIPANMVRRFGSQVSQLESERRGGTTNNRNVNAPININATMNDEMDFRAISSELAWELESK